MIEIDGSFGEGGGQIVRTAVALSAVTRMPVQIERIRLGRPKPGLAPQHAQAILALANICDANTSGVVPGSSKITFLPGDIHGGLYKINIGTAGSVTLLMQCLLPALLMADDETTLEIQGGTDVEWSPTVDYFANVFLPALQQFGAKAKLELKQRGYYPKGQGTVTLNVEPSELEAAAFDDSSNKVKQRIVQGISHSSNLPLYVAKRQADSAIKELKQAGYDSDVLTQSLQLPSTGSGITLWSGWKGKSSLGKRGLPAEKVGEKAAKELILELGSGCWVDLHLADQLIPYLALAGGNLSAREISRHAKTNIWTAEHFLPAKIEIKGKDGVFEIESISGGLS